MGDRTDAYECDAQDFASMTGEEAVGWFYSLAAEAGCSLSDLEFEIEQWGDQWDGYNPATVRVTRPKTEEDREREILASEARHRAFLEQTKQRELQELARLQRKYRDSDGGSAENGEAG